MYVYIGGGRSGLPGKRKEGEEETRHFDWETETFFVFQVRPMRRCVLAASAGKLRGQVNTPSPTAVEV